MNVGKTELHLVRGAAHAEVTPRHRGKIYTPDRNGNHHSVYKYVNVYFYTPSHADQYAPLLNLRLIPSMHI